MTASIFPLRRTKPRKKPPPSQPKKKDAQPGGGRKNFHHHHRRPRLCGADDGICLGRENLPHFSWGPVLSILKVIHCGSLFTALLENFPRIFTSSTQSFTFCEEFTIGHNRTTRPVTPKYTRLLRAASLFPSSRVLVSSRAKGRRG